MAGIGSVLEMENSSVPVLLGDISGEEPMDALQIFKEPGRQPSSVMTIADDSVFHSEDEEISQPALGTSTFMSVGAVWSTGLQPGSQIGDLGTEESGLALCGSMGVMEEGPVYHCASKLENVENSIGEKANHFSYPVTPQAAEREYEPCDKGAAPRHEPIAAQRATAETGEAAQLHVGDKKQMEKSLPTLALTDTRAGPHSEQAGEPQERGESSDTHERVGEMMLPPSGSSGDDPGVYSVCNGSGGGVRAGLNISFNHLSHEKYGTVSYRQIRRGHTRQRIEEFESRMQL